MTEINTLSNLLTDGLTYVANGILLLVYWLTENLPALLSLACAAFTLLTLDSEVQRRAGFRPLRTYPDRRAGIGQAEESPAVGSQPRPAQALTVLVLAGWMIAQTGMAAPVPWIGAAMWLAGVMVLLVIPHHQRFNLLWFVKTGIAVYALLVIGSRVYLGYTAQLTPEQWAGVMGSREGAASVIAGTRGNVTTMVLWALWLVAPLGFFSLLIQQLFVNPLSLINPLAGAQDALKRIRNRA